MSQWIPANTWPLQDRDPPDAAKTFVSVGELWYNTFKTKGKIAYADCFAAALARLRKAEWGTGDPQLKQVEGEIKIIWV